MISEDTVNQATCFAELGILIIIALFYLYSNRKKVIYVLKNRKLPPAHQGRACPGCSSEDLFIMKNNSVRCNGCGAIFASTKRLISKKKAD